VITEKELEKYPDKYPNSGHIYEVRSINLDCETYKDIKKAKSSLKSSINKFSSKTKDVAEITSRTSEARTLALNKDQYLMYATFAKEGFDTKLLTRIITIDLPNILSEVGKAGMK